MSQYGDGDYCSVSNVTHPVARKTHKCSACGETITIGQRYSRTFLVYDGDASTYTRCARCEVIYQHLNHRIAESGDSEEFCDERLACGHEYEERWLEPPPEWLAAMAFWRPGDPLPEVDVKPQAQGRER